MIRPPGTSGVLFSDGSDGDVRKDLVAREALCRAGGSPLRWATIDQVHGNSILRATEPGEGGEADAVWTTEQDLAVAVFTADCHGVVLTGPGAVGVAHAGWRGARSGVVRHLRHAMSEAGHGPISAAVGPGIGPCCYEVGPEVASQFPAHRSTTRWGSTSVDLRSAVIAQLDGLDVWTCEECTCHQDGFFSHRADGTPSRMASIGWIP